MPSTSLPELAIVECRGCGTASWVPAWIAKACGGEIAGGPCCFGHEVLDLERYGSARSAARAWPDWLAGRDANLRAKEGR